MTNQTLDDLGFAEQLLLLACRRSQCSCIASPTVELAWRLGCGDAYGARSFRAFALMRCVLGMFARRPLSLQPPDDLTLSLDERAILDLVAACQTDARTLASALASWLVPHPHHRALLASAETLAAAMVQAKLHLSEPGQFRVSSAKSRAPAHS